MSESEGFLNPVCSRVTLDVFGPRRGILDALAGELPNFNGTLLDIGCGRMPYKSMLLTRPSHATRYVGLDLGRPLYGKPDIQWDGRNIPLHTGSVNCALATEVLEHCPEPQVVLREIARVLSSGGMLFLTVPFLWPLHDSPHDEYRYTPFAIERLLNDAGFVGIKTRPLGGWDASLAQMIGLWLRRRPMSERKREALSFIAAPLVRTLFRKDDRPEVWRDQMMITGIVGTAFKPS
jgi:SAM-dependent methyltransferase